MRLGLRKTWKFSFIFFLFCFLIFNTIIASAESDVSNSDDLSFFDEVSEFFSKVFDFVFTGQVIEEEIDELVEDEVVSEPEVGVEEEIIDEESINEVPEDEAIEEENETIIEEPVKNETEESISMEPEENITDAKNATVVKNETIEEENKAAVKDSTGNKTEEPEENITDAKNATVIDKHLTFPVNETFIDNNQTSGNVTAVNETMEDVNITEINVTVSNETIIINETSDLINVIRAQIIIGKPVKWIKEIDISEINESLNISVEIPLKSENVSVLVGGEVDDSVREVEEYDSIVQNIKREDVFSGRLTGRVSEDISEYDGVLTKVVKWIQGLSLTGQVVKEEELKEKVRENKKENIKEIDVSEIVKNNKKKKIAIEYYTDAPIAVEEKISLGKKVTVSAEDELNYTNVLSYTNISNDIELISSENIRIYWIENKSYVNFSISDFNSDGFIDYVEWIVPHLSTQTFEIIYITKAEHLDGNRVLIKDIYSEVSVLDGVYSGEIKDGEFVRVTFEVPLTNEKDITVYPRILSGSPQIEVYENNGSDVIIRFSNLVEGRNQVLLKALNGEQNIFDLRIINGSLEFDYIVDPVDITPKTCSGQWGADCGIGPPDADNTWDACETGKGSDESVNEIYLNGTNMYPGETLEVICEWDPYTSSDETWIWYYDGVSWYKLFEHLNWGSSSMTNESVTFTVNNTIGTHWVRCSIGYSDDPDIDTTYCVNQGTYYDNDDISFTVSEKPNIIPTTPTPQINSSDGSDFSSQNLNCFDTILDGDSEPMNVSVRWYKNGGINSTVSYNNNYASGTNFNAVLLSGNISVGDIWSCRMVVNDRRDPSAEGSSGTVTILNRNPIVATPTINSSDGSNQASQDLNCFDIVSDPDGTVMTATVRWYKNLGIQETLVYGSVASGSLINSVLLAGNTTKADSWTCDIVLNDGVGSSSPGISGALVVLNTLPANPLPTINSSDGSNQANQDLNCFSSVSDYDTDSMTATVRWYKNSGLAETLVYNSIVSGGQVHSVLLAANTTKGDLWKCDMTLNDGVGNSGTIESSEIAILNTLPDNPTPAINSSDGSNESSQDLNCFSVISDLNNDNLDIQVRWYKNNGLYYTSNYNGISSGTIFNAILLASNTSTQENWKCDMTLNDGVSSSGTIESSEMSIINLIPVVPVVSINSSDGSDRTSQNLNCFATINELDNENMNVTINWYKNNIFNKTVNYNNDYSTGSNFNAVLLASNTIIDDVWKCSIVTTDGIIDSPEGNSSELIILNTISISSSIYNSFDGDGSWGEEWVFGVNVTDDDVGEVNVELYFSEDNLSWFLQSDQNVTCPCIDEVVTFTRDPAWTENYIGASYYLLKLNDFKGSVFNLSKSVSVLKDDVLVSLSQGNGIGIDRDGVVTGLIEAVLTDTDRSLPVPTGTLCSMWVTQNGVDYGSALDSTTSLNICSYDFDPDNLYNVGVQNWIGGSNSDPNYKNENLTIQTLNIVGAMNLSLVLPTGVEKYQSDEQIIFRWNVVGDATEQIISYDAMNVEIISNGGVVTEICSGSIVNEGLGVYSCSYDVPFALSSEVYDVRINVTKVNYNDLSGLHLDKFEIVTDAPSLITPSHQFADDGSWGEQWNYTANLDDLNIGNVNVSLYFSDDNSNWVLQNSQNITCPCVGSEVKFERTQGWNESYIGNSYYQFRANDYHSGFGNVSNSVTVVKDDVLVSLVQGNGISINRDGVETGLLQLSITDADRSVAIEDLTSCSMWVTTNGVVYGSVLLNTTSGNICSYNFDVDNSYGVGSQNWLGGISSSEIYKVENSSIQTLNIVGNMTSGLVLPTGVEKYQSDEHITFRWNVVADATEVIPNADDLTVEIISTGGLVTQVCNLGDVSNEGLGVYSCDYLVPFALSSEVYDVVVNVTESNYNPSSDLFLDKFEIVTDAPSLIIPSHQFSDDGSWGEQWNYTANLDDLNIGNVNVSLYFSNDNSNWVLQNSQDVTCPCVGSEVKFERTQGWNESYIGNSYYQFRANDYHSGFDNLSNSVAVLKDDVRIEYLAGNNTDANRSQLVNMQTRYFDIDRGIYLSGELINYFANYAGVWNSISSDVTDASGNTNVNLVADCSVDVGLHLWKSNVTGSDYKDAESSKFEFIVRDKLDVTMNLNKSINVHHSDVLSVAGKVSDCFSGIISADVFFQVKYSNGTVTTVINNSKSNSSGDYFGTVIPIWEEEGIYSIDLVSNKNYFYNNTNSTTFEYMRPTPITNWVKIYNSNLNPETRFLFGEQITIRANVTDPENNIGDVKLTVDAPSWKPLDKSIMTCVQEIPQGCIYEINITSAYVTESGHWSATVYSEDLTGFMSNDSINFSVSQTPALRSASGSPPVSGWGETFNYNFQVREPDRELMTITLWESIDEINWNEVIVQNYTPSSGGYFSKSFTVNSSGCTTTLQHAIGPAICNLHSQSSIGITYWKISVTDYNRGAAETASLSYIIEKDDSASVYLEGDMISLNRNSESLILGISIKDTDRDVVVEAGTAGAIYDDVNRYPNMTDDSGNLRYRVAPLCDYSVGGHSWRGGVEGDVNYKDSNSSLKSFSVVGWLQDTLTQPRGNSFNVSEQIKLRIDLKSECGDFVTSGDVTLEVLDSSNNSFNCLPVIDEGNGFYNCDWDSILMPEGDYSIRVNSSALNYNLNSTYHKDVFFLNNQFPVAIDLTDTPVLGGWGESFIYAAKVSDAENDEVTCSLFVDTGAGYEMKDSMTLQSPYTCSLSVDDYNSLDIGQYQYKFQLNDTFNSVNTSDHLGILVNGTIEEDDSRIEYLSGDNSVVSRILGASELSVRFKDLDADNYVANEEINFLVYYNGVWNNIGIQSTNADGNSTLLYDPDCSSEVGIHNWKSNYSGTFEYKPVESLSFETVVYGTLGIVIDNPVTGIFHKDEVIDLNSTVSYDCSDTPADVSWELDNVEIATLEKVNWQVPQDYTLGIHFLNVSANKTYYYSDSDNSSFEIWGYADVIMNNPIALEKYIRGTLDLSCSVDDTFGGGISNYPVEFLIDGVSIHNGTTDSNGDFNYTWNNTLYDSGGHDVQCRIIDNSRLYYSTNINEITKSIVVIAGVNADITFSPLAPGPLTRNSGGVSSDVINWSILNLRDENEKPITGVDIQVFWKGKLIGTSEIGSYNIPDDNSLTDSNDTIFVNLTKPNFGEFYEESTDYEIRGVISNVASTDSWSPSINYVNNYAGGPEGGPEISVSYLVKDFQNNDLVEGIDYDIFKIGDHEASTNAAGTVMTPGVIYSGTGSYEGEFTKSKSYSVYGYLAAISAISWEPAGTCVDNFAPTTAICGSGSSGRTPAVDYADDSLVVIDNLGNIVNKANYTEPSGGAANSDVSLKLGDWASLDNVAGDIMDSRALVKSTLDEGAGGFWHGQVNKSKTFTVWDRSFVQPTAPVNEEDVFRTACFSPSNMSLRIYLEDDLISPQPATGATIIFHTPAGICTPKDEGNGYYNCNFNPEDSIIPGNYGWDAEALELSPYHGSGNFSDSWGLQTIDIMGCLEMERKSPQNNSDFITHETIPISFNLTDDLGNIVNSAITVSDIVKHDSSHSVPIASYNLSSKLWDNSYTILGDDVEGIWGLTLSASKNFYKPVILPKIDFKVAQVLTVIDVSAQDRVDRGFDYGYGEVATLSTTINDEGGPKFNATVYYFVDGEYVGQNKTNDIGVSNYFWNPENTIDVGTYYVDVIAHSQFSQNYSGGNATIDIYGQMIPTITNSGENVDRKNDMGYGLTIPVDTIVEDELGARINDAVVEFYIDTIGMFDSDLTGDNGLYSGVWNPSETLFPGTYTVYPNLKNVPYYHNYTLSNVSSTTDVYGELIPTLTMNRYSIYRHDSSTPNESTFSGKVVDENGLIIENANTNFEINNIKSSVLGTDVAGILNYVFNPDNFIVPDNYTVYINATKAFYWAGSNVNYLEIRGKLTPLVALPINETKFYRNEAINFESTLVDENLEVVNADSYSWKFISNSENLGALQDSIWNIPVNYPIGLYTVNLTVEKEYYDTSSNFTSVNIFGNSSVSVTTIPQDVYRGKSVTYLASVVDTNGSSLSDYNCSWFVNSVELSSSFTNSSGICSYTFIPECDYDVGVQELNVTIGSIDSRYYDPIAPNSETTITVKDKLRIDIILPSSGMSLHRTEEIELASKTYDYCSSPPTSSYTVSWIDKLGFELTSGVNSTILVPGQAALGPGVVNASVSGNYYDSAMNSTSIEFYGWSSIVNFSIPSSTHLKGEQMNFNCTARDSNTSAIIEAYPVEFFMGGISMSNTTTDVNGVASWEWDSRFTEPGFYDFECRIKSAPSLFYDATLTGQTSRIEIESKINVAELSVSENLLYRKDSEGISSSTFTMRLTESALGPIADATAHVLTPQGDFTCQSNAQGYCTVIWNPTDTLNPGSYTIEVSGTKPSYNPSAVIDVPVVIRGKLNIELISPTMGVYHKGDNLIFDWNIIDENTNQLGLSPEVKWFNSDFMSIVNESGWSKSIIWQIPLDYKLGDDLLYVNVTRPWFDYDSKSIDTSIYGYSEVAVLDPVTQDYKYGDEMIISCQVNDSNMTAGIENYNVNFYYNDTLIGNNITNSNGIAIHSWNPPVLSNYLIKCIITDDEVLYYNDTKTQDNVLIVVRDTELPVFVNVTVIPRVLETHQLTSFFVNVTDDINMSSAWVEIIKPNLVEFNLSLNEIVSSRYTIDNDYPLIYGRMYNLSYSPDIGGFYNITFKVNDTSGNVQTSVASRFEAIALTDVNTLLLPGIVSVEDISQTTNSTFMMNITCSNIGRATAYNSGMDLGLPSGWIISQGFPYSCGNVLSGEKCFTSFTITVPEAENPDNYNALVNCTWTNPDLSFSSRADNTTVTVTSNAILELNENLITTTVIHNDINTVKFEIQSTGNDDLNNVIFNCSSGVVCSDFEISYDLNDISLIPAENQKIEITVSVPIGYDPGTYYGQIFTNATGTTCYFDYCYDNLTIEVTVPVTKTWERDVSNVDDLLVFNDRTGYYSNITINNTGNVPLVFNMSSHGGLDDSLSYLQSITIQKQSFKLMTVDYDIPLSKFPATYTGDFAITPETGTVPFQLNTSMSLTVSDDVLPIVSRFTIVTPSTIGIADMNNEVVNFETNISDNIGLSNVWVCDDSGINMEFAGGFGGCEVMTNVFGNIYQYNHTHLVVGNHVVYIFARDNYNNQMFSNQLEYRIIDKTEGVVSNDPLSIEIEDVTYFDNSSFNLNVLFSNLNEGGAYATNISLTLPNGNFVSDSVFSECGKVEEVNVSGNCVNDYLVTVLPQTPSGVYDLVAAATWTNPDGTVVTVTNTTMIKVIDKGWDRTPVEIVKTIANAISGEYGQIYLENTGEIPIELNLDIVGNGSSLVSLSDSVINLNQGENQNVTVLYSVPVGQGIGDYLGIVRISNDYYYPPMRNVSLNITVLDDIDPVLSIPTISRTSLEPNYDNVTIGVNATDNVNVSEVWAEIIAPTYRENISLDYTGNNIYAVDYFPKFGGIHSMTIYVNDTSGNGVSILAPSFLVNATTFGRVDSDPMFQVVKGLVYGQPYSFVVNATIRNNGYSTMRDSFVKVLPEYVGAWSSATPNVSCGNIAPFDTCVRSIVIDLPNGASPGSKDVLVNASWMNSDYTNNSVENRTDVLVESNPILKVGGENLSGIVNHGTTSVLGNFSIDSLGNTFLMGVSYDSLNMTLLPEWLSYNPESGIQSIISAGGKLIIDVIVSMPLGVDPGVYSSIINATSSNGGSSSIGINATVLKDTSWSRAQSEIYTVSPPGTIGSIFIDVTNLGNVNLTFDISGAGPGTALTTIPLTKTVPKQTTDSVEIIYTVSPDQNEGNYTLDITIENPAGVPISQVTSLVMEVKDIGPIITNPLATPAQIDINYESTVINATIIDNGFVQSSWLEITLPNGTVETITMAKSGNVYAVPYIPAIVGFYDVEMWSRDNKGLLSNINLNFTSVGKTDLSLSSNTTSVSFTSVTQAFGGSFDIDLDLSNIGIGGAYSSYGYLFLPEGWSVVGDLVYGDIVEETYLTKSSTVSVAPGTAPGSYPVRIEVNWTNPDGTTDITGFAIQVIVESNPLFDIVEESKSETILHGETEIINLIIDSNGNDMVRDIDFECLGVYCENFSVSFVPQSISRIDPGLKENMSVSVSVPRGFSPGIYDLTVRANSSLLEDEVIITINVPTDRTWSMNPISFPEAGVGTDTSSDLGVVNVENFGNVPLVLNSASFNSENLSETVTYIQTKNKLITVPKVSVLPVTINYTAPSVGGIFNATIVLSNSQATPASMNVTTSLSVTEFKVNITMPTIASKINNAFYNQTIDVAAYVTFGGVPLNSNVSFRALVGNDVCNVTSFSLLSGGNWLISCVLPNVIDAKAHDLRIFADYLTIGATAVDTEEKIIIYSDITAPVVESINTNSILIGGSTSVVARITDNVMTMSVWAQITSPSGGVQIIVLNNETSNLTSTDWQGQVGNLSEIGDYDIVVYANDTSGNSRNESSWFEVYSSTLVFGGIFTDADNVPHPGELSFYRDETNLEDINLIAEDSAVNDGEYLVTLRNRTYDARFDVFGHLVILNSVQISRSMSSPIRFDNIPVSQYLAPSTISKNVDITLKGLGIQSVLISNSTEYTFDFSGTPYTDRNLVSVYKCADWIFYTRSCNSTWYELNGTVDFEEDLIRINDSSVSTYAIVQKEKVNVVDPSEGEGGEGSDGGAGTGGSGSSGGGSSSGGSSSKSSSGTTSPPAFDIKTDLIEAALMPGESKMYSLWVTNSLASDAVASVKIDGPVWEYIQLESSEVLIHSKDTESVNLKLFALDTTMPGIYSGTISVSVNNNVKEIPITLLVVSDKNALMDVKVESITQVIAPTGQLKFHVSMYNVGFRKQFDVHLKYTVKDLDEEIILYKEEELALENSLSFIRVFDFESELEGVGLDIGQYLIESVATYQNQTASSVDSFRVRDPIITKARLQVAYWLVGAFVLIFGSLYGWRKYKKYKSGKQRYLVADIKKLPDGKMWLGKVAETNHKAKFSFDDLSTHMIVAGSTGSGKSVSAQIIAEEALKNKLSVVVFDPTAQWSGFVRPCKDDNFLKQYKKFGMKKDDARSFPGMIYEFKNPEAKIDIQKFLNPGEITVFSMAKLTVSEFDKAVHNVIWTIFGQNWEESAHLKVLLVFDEVHRLLGDYGGSGEGYKAIEKAAREFRKWGIGIILCSQVLSDFKDSIKGNVSTEIQMHTKGMADIKRVATKYGKEFADRLTRQEVGVGMLQNPKYNDGKPYFVHFRPLVHSPHKLPEKDLAEYAKFAGILEEIEKKIAVIKSKGTDTTDLELEFKLANDKLKQGRFKMAGIYIESLEKRLE